jgi:hypothetical protein
MVIGNPIEVTNFDIGKRLELIEKVRSEIIKNYNYWQEAGLNIKDVEREAT